MPDGNGFYPPVQYSPLWMVLGILAIVLVVAWIVVALVITRRKRTPVTGGGLVGLPFPTPAVRDAYLGRIDEVTRDYAMGVVEFSVAHQRLGTLVREFAAQSHGVRAPYMTLDDLRKARIAPLSATVGELYPGAFSGVETGSVDVAAQRARVLVAEWR